MKGIQLRMGYLHVCRGRELNLFYVKQKWLFSQNGVGGKPGRGGTLAGAKDCDKLGPEHTKLLGLDEGAQLFSRAMAV